MQSMAAKSLGGPRALSELVPSRLGSTSRGGSSVTDATERSALIRCTTTQQANAQSLPEAVYDLVAAGVCTRERLLTLEHVCVGWRHASQTGHGWKHDVDLSWADPTAAAASSLRTRLVWAHCVKRLALPTRLFYAWFGVPVAADASSSVVPERTPEGTAVTEIGGRPLAAAAADASNARRDRPWSACEELHLHDTQPTCSADRRAVSNSVFPRVATLRVVVGKVRSRTTLRLSARVWAVGDQVLDWPSLLARVWVPDWPSLCTVATVDTPRAAEAAPPHTSYCQLPYLPNLTCLSLAATHTLLLESLPGASACVLPAARDEVAPFPPWPSLPLHTLALGDGVVHSEVLFRAAGATLHSLTATELSSEMWRRIATHCSGLQSLDFGFPTKHPEAVAYILPILARLTSLEHLAIRRWPRDVTCDVGVLRSLVKLRSLECEPAACTPARLKAIMACLNLL